MKTPKIGTIGWTDLTVKHAERVKDFYAAVAGWSAMPIAMGGYDDYCMMPPGARTPAGGICHARGKNKHLPPQWLIYITVADIQASLKACKARGGRIVAPLRTVGTARMAVVRDPAGAVAALYEPERPKRKPAKKKKR